MTSDETTRDETPRDQTRNPAPQEGRHDASGADPADGARAPRARRVRRRTRRTTAGDPGSDEAAASSGGPRSSGEEAGEGEGEGAPRRRRRRRRTPERPAADRAPGTRGSAGEDPDTQEAAGDGETPRRRRRRRRTKAAGAGGSGRPEEGAADGGERPATSGTDDGGEEAGTRRRRRRRRRGAGAEEGEGSESDARGTGGEEGGARAGRTRGGSRREGRSREGRSREGRGRERSRSREGGRDRERRPARDGEGRRGRRGDHRGDRRRDRLGEGGAIEIIPQAPDPNAPPRKKLLLVNAREREEARIALVVDGRLEEVFVESQGEPSSAGNIYRGRIQNVERGIGAAFVDMGRGVTGFLHATDMPLLPSDDPEKEPIDRIRDGDEVIVQVTRDSIGRKGPALTGRISLPGRYLVLMPHAGRSGISRRIPHGRERERVRKLIKALDVPEGMGVIVRTASETTDVAALAADLAHLLQEWERIQRRAGEPGAPGVLRGESDLAERSVRDIMPPDVTRIVVDREEIAGQMHRLLKVWYPSQAAAIEAVGHADARRVAAERDAPLGEVAASLGASPAEAGEAAAPDAQDVEGAAGEAAADAAQVSEEERMARLRLRAGQMPEVEIHTDPIPLFHAFGVETQLEDAYRRSARLPSGGSIVIDPTEALVSIDVNSGRLTDEADPESTALVTNLEAVEEVARQLRLRDLGGIVVIDFIDMRQRSSRRKVEKALEVALAHDRARIRLGSMDPFGLIVLSRQRIRQALARVTHESCEACGGTGRRRSAAGTGLRVMREVQSRLARSRGRGGLEIRAPAEVVIWLKKNRSQELRQLARTCTGPLRLEMDERLARDGWAMKGLPPRGESAAPGEHDGDDDPA